MRGRMMRKARMRNVAVRRRHYRHRWEIFSSVLPRPQLLCNIVRHVVSRHGRGSWGLSFRNVNNEGFFDCLSTRVIYVQRAPDVFFRAQCPLIGPIGICSFPSDNLESDIRGVKRSTKGVAILPEDNISHVVNKVVGVGDDLCGG